MLLIKLNSLKRAAFDGEFMDVSWKCFWEYECGIDWYFIKGMIEVGFDVVNGGSKMNICVKLNLRI